jgi:hypothetical protein
MTGSPFSEEDLFARQCRAVHDGCDAVEAALVEVVKGRLSKALIARNIPLGDGGDPRVAELVETACAEAALLFAVAMQSRREFIRIAEETAKETEESHDA